ncbi:GntR family transcriptional regulator [Bordetella genomosp. 12]|nr:GntR family transcriptional regulator [Bordetella genomosp. 12]
MQRIRLEIVSGKAGPGVVLSVPALAKALGVSTTPVREALLELVRNGLLEPMKNRGFRVLPVSADDLNDLARMRVHLEALAVSSIQLERFGDGARLRELAQAIADAARQSDVQAYVTNDRTFHLELISLAGSRYLTEMIMYLRDNMRIYGLESEVGREQQLRSVDEHFELVALLSRGDKAGAADLISRHIRGWVSVVSTNAPVLHAEAKTRE